MRCLQNKKLVFSWPKCILSSRKTCLASTVVVVVVVSAMASVETLEPRGLHNFLQDAWADGRLDSAGMCYHAARLALCLDPHG